MANQPVIPSGLDAETVIGWLGGPAHTIEEVDGGLFNAVFRVSGDRNEIFVKRFADSAKDPGFPPLPTTAVQRGHVAATVNRLADCVPADGDRIRSARLLGDSDDQRVVAIEAVPGEPLQRLLIDAETVPVGRDVILAVCGWLSRFHDGARSKVATIEDAGTRFKEYKTKLQYRDMLGHLPEAVQAGGRQFTESHLRNRDTVLLGDLNSRNIIVDYPRIRIIDFEQGQVGAGVHDLAYLVSELVIAGVAHGRACEADVEACWEAYHAAANHPAVGGYRDYRRHLAFQVLYRLMGPSRRVWTGHLDEVSRAGIRDWCAEQFRAHL